MPIAVNPADLIHLGSGCQFSISSTAECQSAGCEGLVKRQTVAARSSPNSRWIFSSTFVKRQNGKVFKPGSDLIHFNNWTPVPSAMFASLITSSGQG